MHCRALWLCAVDLLELDGEDLRQLPIEQRKRLLAKLVRPRPGIAVNEQYVGDGVAQWTPEASSLTKDRIEMRA